MSDYGHLHPDFRIVMSHSDTERKRFMDQPRWIGYEKANHIMNMLDDLIERPKRPRMPNLLVVGDPNNGKTTLIRKFYEKRNEQYEDENGDPVKTIILAESPPSADEKGFYISLLDRFYAPFKPSDSTVKLRHQTIHLFRKCQVKMLIVDEFHSLLTGSAMKQREVMNAIKLLCNELSIPIVGVGTREAIRVLHSDPQHASRFDVAILPSWENNKDFKRLLASFEKILPLKKPSALHKGEVASTLQAISRGNFGDLHRLLVECAKAAIDSGEEYVTLDIVKSMHWMQPTKGGFREIDTA